MVMSYDETQVQPTQHAFLVAWGWFAEPIGLVQAFQGYIEHLTSGHQLTQLVRGNLPLR